MCAAKEPAKPTKIAELKPGLKQVNSVFIVLEKCTTNACSRCSAWCVLKKLLYLSIRFLGRLGFNTDETTPTKDNDVMTRIWVADETASVYMCVWGIKGDLVQPGDILRLNNG